VLLLKTKQTISLSMATSSDFRVSKQNREARQVGFGFGSRASLRWLWGEKSDLRLLCINEKGF
jgi:hypothetical protein